MRLNLCYHLSNFKKYFFVMNYFQPVPAPGERDRSPAGGVELGAAARAQAAGHGGARGRGGGRLGPSSSRNSSSVAGSLRVPSGAKLGVTLCSAIVTSVPFPSILGISICIDVKIVQL